VLIKSNYRHGLSRNPIKTKWTAIANGQRVSFGLVVWRARGEEILPVCELLEGENNLQGARCSIQKDSRSTAPPQRWKLEVLTEINNHNFSLQAAKGQR
jgi:hypothetical protein